MSRKPRYIVMIKGVRTLYRGNSRLLAWAVWLVNRRHKAIACDCGIWVVEPAYWISVQSNPDCQD
ncbi:hypothetical protein C7433_11443 [Pantoea sp. PNA 03-3]|nr:hypothetical protein C7433_11443 [Pantoea sp. PNA 03-3]